MPQNVDDGAFVPHLLSVVKVDASFKLTISALREPAPDSVALGGTILSEILPLAEFQGIDLEAPTLAMGNFPDAICCSLGSIIVVILRAMGAMVAYEFKNNDLQRIAKENVGHYVVDAVLRYSAIEGGAEVVMLLSDNENQKDGRIVSFYFRSPS